MLFVSSQALQIAEKDRIKVEHHTLQNVEKSSKSYTNSNQPKPNLPGSLRFGIFWRQIKHTSPDVEEHHR